MTSALGKLFFTADEGVTGRELWAFDPNAPRRRSTALVRDIMPGPGNSNPDHLTGVTGFIAGSTAGGTLYFTANDGVHGTE